MSTRDNNTAGEGDGADGPTSANQLHLYIQALLLKYDETVDQLTMNNESEIKDLQESLENIQAAATAQTKNLIDLQLQYISREQDLKKEILDRDSLHRKFVESRKLLKTLKSHSVLESEAAKKFEEKRPQVDAQLLDAKQLMRDGRAEMERRKLDHTHALDLLQHELEEWKNEIASLRARDNSITENSRSSIATFRLNIGSMLRQIDDAETQMSNMNCDIKQYQNTNAQKKEELMKLKEELAKVCTAHSNDTKQTCWRSAEQEESILNMTNEMRSLQDELAVQEGLTKEIAETNTALQETLSVLEDENTKDNADFEKMVHLYDTQMKEFNNLNNKECEVIQKLNDSNQNLEEAKNKFISSETEVKLLKENISGKYWTGINKQKEWELERKNLLNNLDKLKSMEDARATLVRAVEAHSADLASNTLSDEEGSKARDGQLGELKDRLGRKAQELTHMTRVLEQVSCELKAADADCTKLRKSSGKHSSETEADQRELAATKETLKTLREEKKKLAKNNKQHSREIAAFKDQISGVGEVLKEKDSALAKKTEVWAIEEVKLVAELTRNLDEVKALKYRAENVKLQVNIILDKHEADPENIREEHEATKMADLQKSKMEHKQLLTNYNSTITELSNDLKGITETAAKMEKSNKDNLVKTEALKIKIDTIQDT